MNWPGLSDRVIDFTILVSCKTEFLTANSYAIDFRFSPPCGLIVYSTDTFILNIKPKSLTFKTQSVGGIGRELFKWSHHQYP
jgi:hypothetical protein